MLDAGFNDTEIGSLMVSSGYNNGSDEDLVVKQDEVRLSREEISTNELTNELANEPDEGLIHGVLTNSDWIDVKQASLLLKITERAVQKNVKSGKYQFREIEGSTGRGGISYEIYAPSLPEEAAQKWYAQFPVPTTPVEEIETSLSAVKLGQRSAKQLTKQVTQQTSYAAWKAQLVEQVVKFPRNSVLRSEAIAKLVNTPIPMEYTPKAQKTKVVTRGTLYKWIRDYQKHGGSGLVRGQRSDTGTTRVLVAQEWDVMMTSKGLPLAEMQQIADELTRYVRSLWRSGASGSYIIMRFADQKLFELTSNALTQHNKTFDESMVQQVCHISKRWVQKHQDYQLVHLAETDAKGFNDHYVSHIRRSRDGLLPNDIWVCDVHPLDVAFDALEWEVNKAGFWEQVTRRVHPRLIAWQDITTNRVWVTVVVCPKNRGITRIDVMRSYISAVTQ